MSDERDPFKQLAKFADPEPDPVIMNATIAQSREAFLRRSASTPQASSFGTWLMQSANWLMPASAGVAALVVGIAIAPGIMQSSAPVTPEPLPMEAPSLSRSADQMAIAPSDAPTPATRMGMQPQPGQPPAAPAAELPSIVSYFQGDGVRVGSRLDAEALELFLPDISGDEMIDAQNVMPGEEIEILAAFAIPDRDLFAVQLRVDDVRFWRIFAQTEGGYRREPELSRQVSNAASQAEVIERLAAD